MTATCRDCGRTFGSLAARAVHDCPGALRVSCTDCGAEYHAERETHDDHAADCIIRRTARVEA